MAQQVIVQVVQVVTHCLDQAVVAEEGGRVVGDEHGDGVVAHGDTQGLGFDGTCEG